MQAKKQLDYINTVASINNKWKPFKRTTYLDVKTSQNKTIAEQGYTKISFRSYLVLISASIWLHMIARCA